ncbi:MAG: hypothetical protein QXL94_03925 [Candidatus Parvarchaeum sp.]
MKSVQVAGKRRLRNVVVFIYVRNILKSIKNIILDMEVKDGTVTLKTKKRG